MTVTDNHADAYTEVRSLLADADSRAMLRALFADWNQADAPTPAELERARQDARLRDATMNRIRRGDLPPAASPQASNAADRDNAARWMRQRRQAARKAGYHGPLTRAELAARAAR